MPTLCYGVFIKRINRLILRYLIGDFVFDVYCHRERGRLNAARFRPCYVCWLYLYTNALPNTGEVLMKRAEQIVPKNRKIAQ